MRKFQQRFEKKETKENCQRQHAWPAWMKIKHVLKPEAVNLKKLTFSETSAKSSGKCPLFYPAERTNI